MPSQKNILSAQVVLNSASGKTLSDAEITAENISKILPSAKNIEIAKKTFKELGFEIGDIVGTSFSITAPVTTFVKKLGLKVPAENKSKTGSAKIVKGNLSINKLPGNIADIVKHIAFPDPPDFGPGNV